MRVPSAMKWFEEVDFAAVYNAARGLSCRRRSLSLAIRFVTTASIRAR